MIKIFLSALTVLSVQTSFGGQRRYVNSFEDFIGHTKNHIEEVQTLAKYAHNKWSLDFGDVPFSILSDYLSIHDMAKIANLETLRKFGYEGELTLGERLYEFYGQDISKLSETDRKRFRAIVDEVNGVDHLIRMGFLISRGLITADGYESPLVKKLVRLENLGDFTSRSTNRASPEEFAREMSSASYFFKDLADKSKAIWLEASSHLILSQKYYKSAAVSCKATHLR